VLKTPIVGMLCWEKGAAPRGLVQLGELSGNIAHPETFPFPIRRERIPGADYQTIIEAPNPEVLERMITAAQQMEAEGIRAITTSCGFNAILQRKLANAVSIPVFSSSLMQIPLVHAMLTDNQRIGVITANKRFLSQEHLKMVGVGESIPMIVIGLESTEEFSKITGQPYADMDLVKFRQELLEVARNLVEENPDVGAIVLECTDLPPFSQAIRETTKLPVFDIVTLIRYVYNAVRGLC